MASKSFRLAVEDENVLVWYDNKWELWRWLIGDSTKQLDELDRSGFEFNERQAKAKAVNVYRYCRVCKHGLGVEPYPRAKWTQEPPHD